MLDLITPKTVRATGGGRAYHIHNGIWSPVTGWSHNDFLYDSASIFSRLLVDGDGDYKVAGMYIEYRNVADPDDEVAAPGFGRDGGVSYYDDLASSPDVDFLRVPLTAALRESTDEELYPDGNLCRFFAQTQGSVGIHGKAFGPGSNSKIYGAALVAMPVQGDRTRDLVMSRWYLDGSSQQVVLANRQIGIERTATFE